MHRSGSALLRVARRTANIRHPKGDGKPDALLVVDVNPASSSYGQIAGRTDMPNAGDELHHFGWNACSSALCPYAAHPHLQRRYLIVPGLRSSRIHILDIKDNRERTSDGQLNQI
jgi:selenium-binding protein 1